MAGTARAALPLIVPVLALFGWWAATRNDPDGLVPPPGDVAVAMWDQRVRRHQR